MRPPARTGARTPTARILTVTVKPLTICRVAAIRAKRTAFNDCVRMTKLQRGQRAYASPSRAVGGVTDRAHLLRRRPSEQAASGRRHSRGGGARVLPLKSLDTRSTVPGVARSGLMPLQRAPGLPWHRRDAAGIRAVNKAQGQYRYFDLEPSALKASDLRLTEPARVKKVLYALPDQPPELRSSSRSRASIKTRAASSTPGSPPPRPRPWATTSTPIPIRTHPTASRPAISAPPQGLFAGRGAARLTPYATGA